MSLRPIQYGVSDAAYAALGILNRQLFDLERLAGGVQNGGSHSGKPSFSGSRMAPPQTLKRQLRRLVPWRVTFATSRNS